MTVKRTIEGAGHANQGVNGDLRIKDSIRAGLIEPQDDPHVGTSPSGNSENLLSGPVGPELLRHRDMTIQPEDFGESISSNHTKSRHKRKIFALSATLVLIVGFAVGALLVWREVPEVYYAETRLTYVSSQTKDNLEAQVTKELFVLHSPEILGFSANDTRQDGSGAEREHAAVQDNSAAPVPKPQVWNIPATFPVKEDGSYASWFNKNLSITQETFGPRASVKLTLKGKDPEAVKQLLDTYVTQYADYRREIEAESKELAEPRSSEESVAVPNKEIQMLMERLEALERQERNCALALTLIDSGRGVFSGFVSGNDLTGIPALAKFQEKIVELEISKKSLLVRFTPKSREVMAVDQEIKGIKSAMREYIEAHLHFLKRGRLELIAQRHDLEQKGEPVRSREEDSTQKRHSRVNRDPRFLFAMQDGTQVFREGPTKVKKAILPEWHDVRMILSTRVNRVCSEVSGFSLGNLFERTPKCMPDLSQYCNSSPTAMSKEDFAENVRQTSVPPKQNPDGRGLIRALNATVDTLLDLLYGKRDPAPQNGRCIKNVALVTGSGAGPATPGAE
ncbi:hypothetical protein [Desulfomonile tiedjei]|uniref:Uncharacterized protein n=1 Tax=Desulfomonile tiedjei (strain ATCC 49306 / DSM 6799 / DCB-1) TaxID=706587 RepID=I4C266_DESTA|nr:hypothetical protein [Desulfomonile tiedjei]AFM23657.1 hypothetical protein Desti_0938 [Desulfomonile tiedjei DSM 6799]